MEGDLASHLCIMEDITMTFPAGIAEEVFDTHLLQLLGVAIAPLFALVGSDCLMYSLMCHQGA